MKRDRNAIGWRETKRDEGREREREETLFHCRVCSGPVGFLGSLRRCGEKTYAGGEQVARDEQGVLHGHYARSCPSRNPDPTRTLLFISRYRGKFYVTMRMKERERAKEGYGHTYIG